MRPSLVLLLAFAFSFGIYAEGTAEDSSTQEAAADHQTVSDLNLKMALQDTKDDFEGTRQVTIDAYIPDRKQMAAAARYAEQGKSDLATAMIQTLQLRPPRLESSIKFIRYDANGQRVYFIRCYVSSPQVPFEMTMLKVLVDGMLVEYDKVVKGEEFQGKSDSGPVYNVAYYVQATLDDFTRMGASTDTKLKVYSADDRSLIVQLDGADLQYVRFFLRYLSNN